MMPGLDIDAVRLGLIPEWLERLRPSLDGLAIGGKVWVRSSVIGDERRLLRLLIHELVHVRQWRRLGPVGFPVRYLGDYAVHRLRGLDHHAAYLAIPAEVEARQVAERFAQGSNQ